MTVRAGELRHLLQVQSKIETQSDTGSDITTWTDFTCVWAKMVPLSGREYLLAEQTQSQILVRAQIRAGSGIEPTMRVVYRGLVYNIEAILPDPVSWNEYEWLQMSGGVGPGG